ncbi:hypothetical protein [Bradyrhizobium liaoningense]|uniref:hypothetical protein n=1 Tax=Bradyrhizobium liaoningense TaxID=43992 RepID=UPI001BA4FEB3|nr:hypothetical protein [Bradyrhizobium liaoningense]MBR0714052.1 hypothetical protein [Bradyrhizobium liaoningense]
MRLPDLERFCRIYEDTRRRVAAGEAYPFIEDRFRLGVLLALVRRVVSHSHGLTYDQRLALSNELLGASDEISHRRD